MGGNFEVEQSFQTRILENFDDSFILNSSAIYPGDGLYFVEADVYGAKEAIEIQRLIQERPLVITGLVTNKVFNNAGLAELLPLAMPVEVWGKPHNIHCSTFPLIYT